MAYNLTWMNDVTNFANLTVGLNTALNNWLAVVVMLVVFLITYASTSKNGSTSAMIASGLSTTIIGLLFWIMGIASLSVVLGGSVLLLLFAVAVSFFNR